MAEMKSIAHSPTDFTFVIEINLLFLKHSVNKEIYVLNVLYNGSLLQYQVSLVFEIVVKAVNNTFPIVVIIEIFDSINNPMS